MKPPLEVTSPSGGGLGATSQRHDPIRPSPFGGTRRPALTDRPTDHEIAAAERLIAGLINNPTLDPLAVRIAADRRPRAKAKRFLRDVLRTGPLQATAVVADFDALRFALAHRTAPEAFLYAFDVLELGRPGTSLRGLGGKAQGTGKLAAQGGRGHSPERAPRG